ncbi:MAG TPA: hypothetical protein VL854_13175 [Nitrososphaeraceae archaeon]|nr:hypothetical protein [Nitrososphaeraceae archaeon]
MELCSRSLYNITSRVPTYIGETINSNSLDEDLDAPVPKQDEIGALVTLTTIGSRESNIVKRGGIIVQP